MDSASVAKRVAAVAAAERDWCERVYTVNYTNAVEVAARHPDVTFKLPTLEHMLSAEKRFLVEVRTRYAPEGHIALDQPAAVCTWEARGVACSAPARSLLGGVPYCGRHAAFVRTRQETVVAFTYIRAIVRALEAQARARKGKSAPDPCLAAPNPAAAATTAASAAAVVTEREKQRAEAKARARAKKRAWKRRKLM